MKVSVIIPAYNEAFYIRNCLAALKAQTYKDFEIIVVDNGSTDHTVAIAKEMGVRVITEERRGPQWARERGRKEAVGEIIANVDADCIPPADWMSNAVAIFEDPKVVAATGPYDYYDATPAFRKASLAGQKTVYQYTNTVLQQKYVHMGGMLLGGNSFMRASALAKAGGYNTAISFYGDDTDTAKRMSVFGKVVFSRDLTIQTSARRFQNQGTFKTLFLYIYHFISGTLGWFWKSLFRRK